MSLPTSLPDHKDHIIKFVPFASTVESSFWVRYCREKLETIRLNEDPIPIHAYYSPSELSLNGLPRIQCQECSLCFQNELQQGKNVEVMSNNNINLFRNDQVIMHGSLIGYNTSESFQKVDKNNILRDFFIPQFLQQDASDKYQVAESLNRLLLITFSELKDHKVIYWFGIPSIVPIKGSILSSETTMLKALFDEMEFQTMAKSFQDIQQDWTKGLIPFFMYNKKKCLPLSTLAFQSMLQDSSIDDVMFGFFDPVSPSETNSDSEVHMGWPFRNLVAFLSFHLELGGTTVKIVSYRSKIPLRHDNIFSFEYDASIILNVKIPNKEDYGYISHQETTDNLNYKVVGWELNNRSKAGPRVVNLRPLLDSNHLSIEAADLNLKLMKWRMIPNLNVDKLKSCKVTLLGAGTLGCSVARTLLGWGVRKITFVDYGKVSYSNPVRQNLFTLDDCHADNGTGKSKAVAAAENLRSIAADVESEGIVLSIPMPGHAVDDIESLHSTISKLDQLIRDSDIIFLLTDTRESRWLPTVMAAAHNKLLINAALGLDSWLVMRHGGGITHSEQNRYGCYFCNDVVAPENSTKNRTLDQQCTVTRPGLAPIASSMAVELMVAMLHHPDYLEAAAPKFSSSNFTPTANTDNASPLGLVPHQIRGSIVSYTMMIPTVPAFKQCTACSQPIILEFRKNMTDFVRKASESVDGSYLENVSGLAAFRAEAASSIEGYDDWDEDE